MHKHVNLTSAKMLQMVTNMMDYWFTEVSKFPEDVTKSLALHNSLNEISHQFIIMVFALSLKQVVLLAKLLSIQWDWRIDCGLLDSSLLLYSVRIYRSFFWGETKVRDCSLYYVNVIAHRITKYSASWHWLAFPFTSGKLAYQLGSGPKWHAFPMLSSISEDRKNLTHITQLFWLIPVGKVF